MTPVAAALAAQMLAVVGTTKPNSDWRDAEEPSLVAVTSHMPKKDNPAATEPASGFVVGWKRPLLYVVTAAHVVEDMDLGVQAKAVDVMVRLSPELCDSASVTAVQRLGREVELDAAVLTVELPAKCFANVAKLRRAPMSAAAVVGMMSNRQAAELELLGRAASGGIAKWRIHGKVSITGDVMTVQTDIVQKEMSGSPVFTETGELVAIASAHLAGKAPVAFLTNYRVVRERLRQASVDAQFAGDFAVLELAGAPPGSSYSVDDGPTLVLDDRPNLLPPGERQIQVANTDGYEPAWIRLNLEPEKHVKKCVTLTREGDRRAAKWRKPLLWTMGSLFVASAAVGGYALYEHAQFDDMPSSDALNYTNKANFAADGALILGTASLVLIGVGYIFWTPREASSIHDCGR
jgi:hypothetical protein